MRKFITKFFTMSILIAGTISASAQVVIDGNVFGGGRMADVKGNVTITVNGQSSDATEILGVYGGNDIAGSVEGGEGANITIGSTCNNVIRVNSVYGGGNGYYQYGTTIDGANVQALDNGTLVKTFNGADDVVTLTTDNNVPSIVKSTITVKGNETKIDSVFGGAKNAYVTELGNYAATINIQNGIINQVFGGNNYGGFINGNISIALNGVKEPLAQTNAQYASIGEDWGVCTIFGGGNKVPASGNVTIDLLGGYVDTVFAGGNSATVGGTTVNANFVNSIYTAGTDFDGASGFYNVRTLFGGNNQASMDVLPTLNLIKGGMGDVYGGGNAGDMLAGNTTMVSGSTLSTYVSVNSDEAYLDVLYGGCRQASVGNGGGTYIDILNGHIGNVYGGCNISGTVADATGTNVIIRGGTIEENVFGGSNGYYGCRDVATFKYTNNLFDPSVDYTGLLFPLTNTTHVTVAGGLVKGSVYGGGKMAPVGEDRVFDGHAFGTNQGSVDVKVQGGTIEKNVFAGGMMADVYGVGNVAVSAGTIQGNVYGGNDIAGALSGTMSYVASNTTAYDVTSHVTITGAPDIQGDVFGSGNGDYTYYTSTSAYDAATEPNKVLVCDATMPVVPRTFVDINVDEAARLNNVYAGGNNATATESAVVLLNQNTMSTSVASVDNIFGGNNTAAMEIRPEVILTKGNVNTVYGGGNKGEMLAHDATVLPGHELGTFVELNNDNVKVSEAIYGGGKMAGVSYESYVLLAAGSAPAVFGGNDISGNVSTANIVLEGNATIGDLYGGGNGQYYYDGNNVYDYNDHSRLIATGSSVSVPNADATFIKLNSGTVNNVYGGGLAGDVANANTDVTAGATITGALFGGGCGDVASIGLCTPHVGNVTNMATLNINGLHDELPRVFAGGRAGNVQNATINVSADVDKKILALYGGCMASDLLGTTIVNLGEPGKGASAPLIDTVYGGNDYAGLTQNTIMTVNSGTYTHVFGGGNGDYDYKQILQNEGKWNADPSTCFDTLPYSMNIDVTYNDGLFIDRVFGGGNMALVGDKHISSTNYPQGSVNRDLMGVINVNVHGGRFNQHIFVGAKGNLSVHKNTFGFQNAIGNFADWNFSDNSHLDSRPSVLAYAYKQFNMDGGFVEFSVYGGSEAVDDGFPYECYGSNRDSTSMAPSTILNIVGGTVANRVYGGGYKGNCYGSIYVNVGREAVYDCPAWTTEIGTKSGSSVMNPYVLPDSYFEAAYSLRKTPLYLNSSIYNGSDWGEAGDNQYFNTRGFYGGVGRICIDGLGYQTSISHASSNPEMNISKSLIGAGTSTNPADINSRILVRNYGDFYCPSPSKQLYSIQRTDYLYLENANITLTGEQDAFQSFTSSSQALCRIDTVVFHGSNVLEQNTSSIYVGMIISEDEDGNLEKNYENSNADMWSATLDGCTNADDAYICNLLSTDVVSRNVFMLNNGSYVDVYPFVDGDNNGVDDNDEVDLHNGHDHGLHPYGPVEGYLYLMASHGTKAYVYARDKKTLGGDLINTTDGGFLSPCRGTNVVDTTTADHTANYELDYVNVPENDLTRWPAFRSWSVGDSVGSRSRSIAIVAHANPEKVIGDEYCTMAINGTDTTYYHMAGESENGKFAYATVSLELPPANGGNYYTINAISIDNNNGNQVKLTDWAWDPKKTADGCSKWYTSFSDSDDNPLVDCSVPAEQMQNNPDYTFGLMMHMSGNFNPTSTEVTSHTGTTLTTQNQTIISGNKALTNLGGFTSSQIVAGARGVIPTIDFTLSYRTDFTTTITREVTFTMNEYTAAGQLVGPVDVTVTISTIITDFRDLEARTLAMYNNGRTNNYVRQVIIPASFMQRELYLTEVEWYADKVDLDDDGQYDGEGEHDRTPDYVLHPADQSPNTFEYNDFSMTISPSEDITQNISNSLGWYRIESQSELIDPYSLVKGFDAGVNASNSGLKELPTAKKIGVLDGRAAASLNVTLNFNGSILFDNYDPVGWMVMKFRYINTGDKQDGEFSLKVRVRTRESGDTIYLAEPKNLFMLADGSVFRNYDPELHNAPENPVVTLYRYDENDLGAPSSKYDKNDPAIYLSNFNRAGDVYDEGDVICILDTIHIDTKNASSLRGSNFGNIYVTRYTGSHFRFPGKTAAYRGPMIMLQDGSKFTAANVIFYGGGVGRVATQQPLTHTPNTSMAFSYTGLPNNLNPPAGYTAFGSFEYDYHKTKADTLFADAPVFWLEGDSWLNLATNVEIIDNYNKSAFDGSYVNAQGRRSSFPGGAIGMRNTAQGTPQVILGNMVRIHNNLVTDHIDANGPLAYGGAVFNDAANLTLSVEHPSVKNLVQCDSNYYIPYFDNSDANVWGIVGTMSSDQTTTATASENGLKKYFTPSEVTLYKPHSSVPLHIDYVDLKMGAAKPEQLHNSNVYLTRTVGHGTFIEREDGESDADYLGRQMVQSDATSTLINVASELDSNSRIGVSKWFPGFIHRDIYPRDTIAFASYAQAGSFAATNNAASGVFMDDSSWVTTDYRIYLDRDQVEDVCGVNTPEDEVDIRFSTLLNPTKIYLHRCGSFREQRLPIIFAPNASVVCPGDGDTIRYMVQGGAASYVYKWERIVSGDGSVGDPYVFEELLNQAGTTFEKGNGYFVPHNLSLNSSEDYKELRFRATATESGGCQVYHDFKMLLKQVGTDEMSGSATTSSLAGGQYVHVEGEDPYFMSSYIDSQLAPNEGDKYYLNDAGDPHTKTAAAIHYAVPGSAYTSLQTTDKTNPNVGVIARFYNYYKLKTDVSPAGSGNVTILANGEPMTTSELLSTKLCPGDILELNVTPTSSNYEFMMWDYDPTASSDIFYVVQDPSPDATVTAYMSPNQYWYKHVNRYPDASHYYVDYHGNVHIKDETGLAWFISTVNGLNGQQAQTFIFDTIYIYSKDGGYDMKDYKWTPLGNTRLPFRGVISPINTGSGSSDIRNIIVNEPELEYIGFFGVTDSARISEITLDSPIINGTSYGAALVGYASDNTILTDNVITNATISASNGVGGFAGRASNSSMNGNRIENSKFVGPSLYAGSVAEMENSEGSTLPSVEMTNNSVDIDVSKLNALYVGGLVGRSDGYDSPVNPNGAAIKSNSNRGHLYLANNYVRFTSGSEALYAGGLVGYASNTDMENNYAYGSFNSMSSNGGIVGRAGNGININHCYYDGKASSNAIGSGRNAIVSDVTTFSGSGNQVILNESIDGLNNMTRVLNTWVRQHGMNQYNTWRSDLNGVNHGYPIFGSPDMIPVYDTINDVVCDQYVIGDTVITESGTYNVVLHDTLNFVDSTLTFVLTINHSEQQEIFDSITLGEDYMENGFSLYDDMIRQLLQDDTLGGVHVLQVIDSLLTAQGCDSIVVLNLVVRNASSEDIDDVNTVIDVKVYPNPTIGVVNVEAEGLRLVDVYDNASRHLLNVQSEGDAIRFDLSKYTSGSYYLRIVTSRGVVVRKVIKR